MKKLLIVIISLILVCHVTCRLFTPGMAASQHNKKEKLRTVGPNGNVQCSTIYSPLFLQNVLPAGNTNISGYSGYLQPNSSQNSCFGFIFWGSQAANGNAQLYKNYPTIMWLQGGPGGSSQMGNFIEFGPLLPNNATGTVQWNINPWTWNLQYNLLFIDNPIGTGISYADQQSDIPTNQDQVAASMWNGLQQLFYNQQTGLFSILQMDQTPFFIFGESYAGKYVPSIAQYILQQNEVVNNTIPLKGIGVGDGFTDPVSIMSQLGMFGYNLGLIDMQERQITEGFIIEGQMQAQNNQWLPCQQSFDAVTDSVMDPSGMQDVYNFRQYQETYVVNLTTLMQMSSTQRLFNLNPNITANFQEITNEVYDALSNDFMQRDCVQRLSYVLNQGLQVLYYNGQNDVIVCTPCTESWLDQVEYPNITEFAASPFQPWMIMNVTNGTVVGYNKSAGNLEFKTINKAGHMVPMDQPQSAWQMVTDFITRVLAK